MTLKTAKGRRRGLTAIAVLVCLIIVTLVSGAVVKVALAQRDWTRGSEHRLQAQWLADAGIQRAVARLAIDPGYTGETWEISARDLDSTEPGAVTIAVGQADEAKHRQIRVQADYPRDPPGRARRSVQILVE
jgi:Tfp pilus assembly protein PilX